MRGKEYGYPCAASSAAGEGKEPSTATQAQPGLNQARAWEGRGWQGPLQLIRNQRLLVMSDRKTTSARRRMGDLREESGARAASWRCWQHAHTTPQGVRWPAAPKFHPQGGCLHLAGMCLCLNWVMRTLRWMKSAPSRPPRAPEGRGFAGRGGVSPLTGSSSGARSAHVHPLPPHKALAPSLPMQQKMGMSQT